MPSCIIPPPPPRVRTLIDKQINQKQLPCKVFHKFEDYIHIKDIYHINYVFDTADWRVDGHSVPATKDTETVLKYIGLEHIIYASWYEELYCFNGCSAHFHHQYFSIHSRPSVPIFYNYRMIWLF